MAAVVATAGCQGGKVTCSSVGNAGDTATWADCSDGNERQIKCDPPTGQGDEMRHACTCIEGGVVGKKFEMADLTTLRRLIPPTPEKTIQASYDVVNKQCGWNLRPK
ncbi:MAG: hypothetical protein JRI23_27085 [Deltaproteobacteria bacterium]|nr:hypothetical protein [Deltaproteobacteria bacterium]MBW2535747.1 hypothetical protein [Deltaproteobacteria bacterium]